MSTNDKPWDITDDSDLKAAVRDETDYDSTLLPETTTDGTGLHGLIDSGKRTLALKAGVTNFYDDRGLTVALLGIVCAKAKGAVENSPVVVKDVSGQNVTFRTSDGSSLQVSHYEEMVQLGLSEAESTDDTVQNIRFTNDYLSDSTGQW